MAARHITGCSKITDILNSFGHSISHSALHEYDTALAEIQLRSLSSLPAGIECNKFSTFVWDNIDFCKEIATGHGTIHCTNGIIIQQNTQISLSTNDFFVHCGKKSRNKTLNQPKFDVLPNYLGK